MIIRKDQQKKNTINVKGEGRVLWDLIYTVVPVSIPVCLSPTLSVLYTTYATWNLVFLLFAL